MTNPMTRFIPKICRKLVGHNSKNTSRDLKMTQLKISGKIGSNPIEIHL